MKRNLINRLMFLGAAGLWLTTGAAIAKTPDPIRVLMISGGCCHNYANQRQLLENGLKARLKVTVSHVFYDPKAGEQATRPKLPIYGNPGYADGFDVVIHNECAADETDPAALEAVLAPHRKGIAAVNLHCAMHSYRSGTWREPVKAGDTNAKWFEFTGIQSSGHGAQSPITLTVDKNAHPIAKGLKSWTTSRDELYNNLTIFGVTPFMTGVQPSAPDPAERSKTFAVAWTHSYGPAKARVFSTTLAHNEAVMSDPNYLDMVARGVAWASGHMNADGNIAPGYTADQ